VARPIHLCAVAGGGFWRCYRPASVGRSPGADIHLQHPSVSRAHAVIGRCGRAWFVRDNRSTNGTWLNGARVTSTTDTLPLRPGDLIQFGEVALRVVAGREAPFAPIQKEWLAWGDGAVARVALTGYGQDEDRRRTREAGFDRHLVKPVSPDDLRGLLAEGHGSPNSPVFGPARAGVGQRRSAPSLRAS
jgi:pSer/pThr/pTyr-binding forkhead associated (FHA) protein